MKQIYRIDKRCQNFKWPIPLYLVFWQSHSVSSLYVYSFCWHNFKNKQINATTRPTSLPRLVYGTPSTRLQDNRRYDLSTRLLWHDTRPLRGPNDMTHYTIREGSTRLLRLLYKPPNQSKIQRRKLNTSLHILLILQSNTSPLGYVGTTRILTCSKLYLHCELYLLLRAHYCDITGRVPERARGSWLIVNTIAEYRYRSPRWPLTICAQWPRHYGWQPLAADCCFQQNDIELFSSVKDLIKLKISHERCEHLNKKDSYMGSLDMWQFSVCGMVCAGPAWSSVARPGPLARARYASLPISMI